MRLKEGESQRLSTLNKRQDEQATLYVTLHKINSF